MVYKFTGMMRNIVFCYCGGMFLGMFETGMHTLVSIKVSV